MREDDEIFDRYYANRRMETDTGDCSGDCKTNTLCDLLSTTSQMFLSCLLYTMGVENERVVDAGIYDTFGSVYGEAPRMSLSLSTHVLSLITTFLYWKIV